MTTRQPARATRRSPRRSPAPLAAVGTLGTAAQRPTSGLETALDGIWMGITTLVLIGAGLRLLRRP